MGPTHIMQQHLHDGPIWASPKISAYLHVDSTNYFKQYMLHGLQGAQVQKWPGWCEWWSSTLLEQMSP